MDRSPEPKKPIRTDMPQRVINLLKFCNQGNTYLYAVRKSEGTFSIIHGWDHSESRKDSARKCMKSRKSLSEIHIDDIRLAPRGNQPGGEEESEDFDLPDDPDADPEQDTVREAAASSPRTTPYLTNTRCQTSLKEFNQTKERKQRWMPRSKVPRPGRDLQHDRAEAARNPRCQTSLREFNQTKERKQRWMPRSKVPRPGRDLQQDRAEAAKNQRCPTKDEESFGGDPVVESESSSVTQHRL